MNISVYTSLILKLIGVIFIVSSLIDYVTIAVPPQLGNPTWLLGIISGIVDRGIVPMVGMACILIGYWIDAYAQTKPKSSKLDLRLPTYVLSSILGFVFLACIVLHAINLNQVKETTFQQIQQGQEQGQQQIEAFLAQVNSLSQNPQLLTQQIQQRSAVIESGQFQGRSLTPQQIDTLRQQRDQLQQLKDLSREPQKFKARIEEITKNLQTNLVDQRKQAEAQTQSNVWEQAIRIWSSSLMLAIGYSVIGWFGILGIMRSPAR